MIKHIIIGFCLIVSVCMPTELAAQDCDTIQYSLVNFIVESKGINLLGKGASSGLVLCTYSKMDTISKYNYFIKNVLPQDKDVVKEGIDSISFQSYLNETQDYQWDINCIDKLDSFYRLKKLRWWIPGKLKYKIHNPPETYYTISKPLFTKDNKYAIVSVETYSGFSSGFGDLLVFKRNDDGSWEFFADGGCGYSM